MASHWNFINVSGIPSQFFFYCILYIFNFDCFQVLKLGNCTVTVQTPCISLCSKFLCGQKQQVLYVIKYGHILSKIPCLPEINLQLSSTVCCSPNAVVYLAPFTERHHISVRLYCRPCSSRIYIFRLFVRKCQIQKML